MALTQTLADVGGHIAVVGIVAAGSVVAAAFADISAHPQSSKTSKVPGAPDALGCRKGIHGDGRQTL